MEALVYVGYRYDNMVNTLDFHVNVSVDSFCRHIRRYIFLPA